MADAASRHVDNPILGLILRLIGIACLAVMAAMIKLASEHGVHLLELVFARQIVSVPIILVWASMAGGIGRLATKRPKAHAVRSLYGVIGMFCNFGALMLLPLAEATTINFSAPIWAVVLSMVLLKEKVRFWRWSAVIAGFAGIVIIAQPSGGNIPLAGAAVALAGAFMIALISIQIRDLNRTESPMAIVFWLAVMSSICVAPFVPFVIQQHSTTDWLLLLAIGVAGTGGQLLFTTALRYGNVSSIIVMDYSSIAWATLLGWLIWDNLPPATTWLGAPLIVASGIVIAWRERTLARRRFADQRQATGA